jgi:hypothetical protein
MVSLTQPARTEFGGVHSSGERDRMLSFSFESRGRRYDCITEGIRGSGLSFPGHWMYQPSVITPSPLTAGQHVLLFISNHSTAGDNRWRSDFSFYLIKRVFIV